MATIENIDGRPIFEHRRDDGRRARCSGCGDVVSPFETILADHLPLDLHCEWGWSCGECGFTDVPASWSFFYVPITEQPGVDVDPATAVVATESRHRTLFE